MRRTVTSSDNGFDMNTALFCAGLAFDSYVEPPSDSSRWERGVRSNYIMNVAIHLLPLVCSSHLFFVLPQQSKGMNVAFVSNAFARNLYKGLVEVTPIMCSDLPDEDSTVESIATGGGVDACVMVAAVEGNIWKEDVQLLEQEQFHEGVFS
ncbi:MAG: hypothetical protein SGARI_008291, partial [Bacillariaceae sp.]